MIHQRNTNSSNNNNNIQDQEPQQPQRRGRSEKSKELDQIFQKLFVAQHEDQQRQQLELEKEKNANPRVKWIKKKLEALAWVSLGGYLAYYTDLINILLYSSKVDRFYFSIGLVGLLVFFVFYIYVAYINGAAKQSNSFNWEKEYPRSIITATVALIVTTFGFIKGLWPIWGWYTPALLFVYTISISYFV